MQRKPAIAKAAAELVQNGDVVFLDAGTTTLEVACQLVDRDDLTIVTNCLDILSLFAVCKSDRLFLTGVAYFDINHGFYGPATEDAIRQFNVDKVFLSVGAVDLYRTQISINSPQMAQTQRKMIEIAQKVYVVADASKFGHGALSVVERLETLDHIIADTATRELIDDLPENL